MHYRMRKFILNVKYIQFQFLSIFFVDSIKLEKLHTSKLCQDELLDISNTYRRHDKIGNNPLQCTSREKSEKVQELRIGNLLRTQFGNTFPAMQVMAPGTARAARLDAEHSISTTSFGSAL